MTTNNPDAKSITENRTDLQITVCSNGVINVHNPDGNHGTHSVMLGAEGNAIRCSCKGHRYNGHCYHADEIEARPLVLSAASCAAQSKKVATDGGSEFATSNENHVERSSTGSELPDVTYHTEPEYVGGARYARCEGCENEAVEDTDGEMNILHSEDCPRQKIATDGGEQRDTVDVHGCAACDGFAYGDDEFCSEECGEKGKPDYTPL